MKNKFCYRITRPGCTAWAEGVSADDVRHEIGRANSIVPGHIVVPEVADLDTLLGFLQSDSDDEARHYVDWTNLPTFGGEPLNVGGTWSWDETRALIGTCAADVQIVSREWLNE